MKLRALVLLNAFVLALTAHGQLLMKAGDSYVFQFKRLDLYGVDFTSSGGAASWITGMQGADGEDSLRMEIFEGGIEEPALAEQVMNLRQGGAIVNHPTAWADHAGAVRITVLEGSFTLSELIVRHLRPNPSGTFDLFQVRVPVVPIEMSFADGAASITFTAFAGKRYIVEATDDVGENAVWNETGVKVENSDARVTVPAGMASTSRKLYRLRVEDAPVIAPLR